MKQRLFPLLITGFFFTLFAVGAVLYLLNGQLARGVGFLLLSASNMPHLLSIWQDRDISPGMTRFSTFAAVAGLVVVFISFLQII